MLFFHDFTLNASGVYGDVLIPLNSKRPYKFSYDKDKNIVNILLKNTKSEELDSLYFYNETLLRKVVVRDHSEGQFEVLLFLKKRKLEAYIYTAEAPFRIIVSIYDKDYTVDRDPTTNLPSSGLIKEKSSIDKVDTESFFNRQENMQKDKLKDKSDSLKRYRFVQPEESVKNNESILAIINSVNQGRGLAWDNFPKYIYPLDLSNYFVTNMLTSGASVPAVSQQIAKVALNRFIYGNELQALKAYEQVFAQDPNLFDREPIHLWALAEANFGKGNLLLADSYHQSVIKKFPSFRLTKFSQLRRVDIKAIQTIKKEKFNELKKISLSLEAFDKTTPEIKAQSAVRASFWNRRDILDQKSLPFPPEAMVKTIEDTISQLKNAQTKFLAKALLVKDSLSSLALFDEVKQQAVVGFLKEYSKTRSREIIDDIKELFRLKIIETVKKLKNDGLYQELVSLYRLIPSEAKEAREDEQVLWATAYSYRKLNKDTQAVLLYKKTLTKTSDPKLRFKSIFWLTLLSKRNNLKNYDSQLLKQWNKLREYASNDLKDLLADGLDIYLASQSRAKTPALMVLSYLRSELSGEEKNNVSAGAAKATEEVVDKKTAEQRVFEVVKLANKFKSIGNVEKAEESILLLKKISPKDFVESTKANSLWKNSLIDLADSFRQKKQFLKAGILYTYVAENVENWDKRAEVLYKGGILLFKGGNRVRSIEAFTAASQDGNNLLYANLAKERLTQMGK